MSHPQEKAIAHVTTLAAGESSDPSWRVTLHFRPDRLVAGTPILQLMAQGGVYRSQFETGTSNGGLTRILGDASRTGRYDEQALKRVWHYVARFGSPETRT